MIIVEKEFEHDGKKYLQIRIHTACCKRQFIVEDKNTTMIDLESGTEVLDGMFESIRYAQKMKEEIILIL